MVRSGRIALFHKNQPTVFVLKSVELLFRGLRTEDRRARFARARQRLLLVGKVTEDGEKSAITQGVSNLEQLLSSVFSLLKAFPE
ncbi:hypothetical protein BES34_007015 [Leptospira inadai serovar Lyme]|uniref:Uncharacterized protein n=1 Tax=Leptospira inadai serovar Lyme TaxID=293084 RepID=A0ABX4YKG6_9LEPT|nr:hypothetical protein BES34_007015 [Leptospira inadai serovar Lyme]